MRQIEYKGKRRLQYTSYTYLEFILLFAEPGFGVTYGDFETLPLIEIMCVKMQQ